MTLSRDGAGRDDRPTWMRKVPALLILGWLCFHFIRDLHEYDTDRWRRKDLETRFPAGASPHHVLLVNDSTSPLYAVLRSKAWSAPRCELLLPKDEQWVDVPTDGDSHLQFSAMRLDMEAAQHQVLDVPDTWSLVSVSIDDRGTASFESLPGGDVSPKRSLIGVTSAYELPARIEMPYDAHERPAGRDYEVRAWIGPGTHGDSATCACAIRPGVQITCAAPRPAQPQLQFDEPVSADTSTRIVLRWNGTVTRDTISAGSRFRHWAGI
jgi:hypothetical protein